MIASRVKRFLIVFVVLVLIAAVLTHFLNPVIRGVPQYAGLDCSDARDLHPGQELVLWELRRPGQRTPRSPLGGGFLR